MNHRLRHKRAVLIIVAMTFALVLVTGVYFAINFLWALTHPNYRHVATSEIVWPKQPTFQNCWNDDSKRFVAVLIWTSPGGSLEVRDAQGTYLPVNADPAMVLSILIPNREVTEAGAPSMQLGITSLVEVSNTYTGPT